MQPQASWPCRPVALMRRRAAAWDKDAISGKEASACDIIESAILEGRTCRRWIYYDGSTTWIYYDGSTTMDLLRWIYVRVPLPPIHLQRLAYY